MTNDELNTSEGLPKENLTPDETGSDVGEVKDILNETLGKNFKDDETALKAVKDTFNFVGKAGQLQKVLDEVKKVKGFETEKEAMSYLNEKIAEGEKGEKDVPDDYVSHKDLAERDFFNENPQYKPYQRVIKTLAKDKGVDIAEVVNSEELKPFLEKVVAHDKAENDKSVIHSNSRIKISTDKMVKAKEKLQEANKQGGFAIKEKMEADKMAVDGVIDAYSLNQQNK